MKKKCKYCGNDFTPNKQTPTHQQYCSERCNRRAIDEADRIALTDRIVKHNIYVRSKGAIKYSDITPEMIAAKRKSVLERREKIKNNTPVYKSCKVYFPICSMCGETFTARNSKAHACSDKCSKEYRALYSLEMNKAKMLSKTTKERLCKECNKPFISEYGSKRESLLFI